MPLLDKHLGDWKGTGEAPAKPTIADGRTAGKTPRVFLIDQPGAVQANIFAGQVVPSTKDASAIEFDIANSVLGGEFSSRLNMNLRENKHWAYGAYSFSANALGQRPWMAFAPVQIDKTADSLKELQREISDYASGQKPPTAAEVAKIQATEIRGLPGSFETASAVLGAISAHRPLRPSGRLRVQAQGRDRSADAGAGQGRRRHDRSGRVDLGGRRRPQADRAAGARAEARRGAGARRRRQDGGGAK